MLKIVYNIDNEGYLIDSYVATLDDNNIIVDEDKKDFIAVDMPDGHDFLRPRWINGQWIEGATQQELEIRNGERLMNELIPTSEQIIESELEIKIINLLIDMGVI